MLRVRGVFEMSVKKIIPVIGLSLLIAIVAFGFQKPTFTGDWTMDQDRSYGLPPNQRQSMKVSQAGDQIDLETTLINGETSFTIKDSFTVDGKQRDFTPQGPKGAVPGAKGKRTANWLPNGRGIAVDEETTTETPKGVVAGKLTRKWTISSIGDLVIEHYVDTPEFSYETKRIFKKKRAD